MMHHRTDAALTRSAFVYALARAKRCSPADLFAALHPADDVAPYVFMRTAAPVATTGDSGFAAELVQTAVADFLGSLAPLSAAAALMRGPNALTVDATATTSAFNIPLRSTAPAAPGWVAEGAPIQVRDDVLATVTLGPARKIGSIVVMTREVMKRTSAAQVFETVLREDAAKGLDAAVFSSADGNGDEIAGLLYGATEVAGTGDAMRDMQRLAHAVSIAGSGQVAFIGGPAMAAALNLDRRISAPVLPSPAVAETRLIAVDPLSIAWGADSEPGLEVSIQAIVHMHDEPDPIVTDGTPASPVRSAWQTDCIVTRLLLDIAFVKRRAAACAFTDYVDYIS